MNMNFSSYHANNGHVDFGRRHAVYDSLDHCKANISDIGIGFGLGHHVPDYESFGTEIEATDVLCGRGKTSFNHVGNRRFRDLIAASTDKYNNAKSRLEKSMVVHSIVEEVKKVKGRFLKQDRYSGRWFELDERQAKEKVGHAIRDATSSVDPSKKKIPVLKIRKDSKVLSPFSEGIDSGCDQQKLVVRTVSSDFSFTSDSSDTNIPTGIHTTTTKSKVQTVVTTSTSSSWDDLEPLGVDSMEARNSLAALRKNDFFLKAVLGYSASSSKALSSSSGNGDDSPVHIGCD